MKNPVKLLLIALAAMLVLLQPKPSYAWEASVGINTGGYYGHSANYPSYYAYHRPYCQTYYRPYQRYNRPHDYRFHRSVWVPAHRSRHGWVPGHWA